MKIAIQKLSTGKVKISLAADSGKKPIEVELTPEQIRMLTGLIETAQRSSQFQFVFEA